MGACESLVRLIKKQVETQNSLLEIEGQKTSVLARNDIDALSALINLEQPLVMRLEALERRYEELRRELAPGDVSFRQLVDALEPEEGRAVEEGLKELSAVAGRLKRAGSVNMGILTARQRTIRQLLAICGVQEQTLTYNREGRCMPQASGV